VLDEDGSVAASYQGEQPVETVLEVIGRTWIPQSVFDDSFLYGERADCLHQKRRSAIREGRYRTPDRQRQIRMREVLKDRFEEIPVQVPRSEIEALGVEIGLEDPLEAARIFDRLKGVSWRGDYVRTEEGWVAAWVVEVN
jgi:hypothetical protein